MKTLRISVDQISEYSYLEFGERGENAVTEVILDFASWVEEFGEGIVNLYVKRGGDTSAYPVPLSIDGTVATWIVSETDTYKRGRGEAEYVYIVGEKIEKTAVFGFYVRRDIGQPASTPPSPYETWLETLMELSNVTLKNAQDAENAAGEAAESADKAETAASHYPVIVDNYWYVWRVEEEAYVNTGVKAEGEDFTIKGTVATVADLPSEARQGDFWNVGTEAPYTMYMYQVGEGWINQGTLQGPTGTTFIPSVSEAGIISWTNDGGKSNPTARNIRGPQGIQGEKGDTGDAAGFGTPVASADQTIGQASVSVTASGPNTAKVFDFRFSGIKGEQGVQGAKGEKGEKGDPGEDAPDDYILIQNTQPTSETNKIWLNSGTSFGIKVPTWNEHVALEEKVDENTAELVEQKSAIEALDSLVDRKAGMLVDTASGTIASFVSDATIDNLLGVTVDIEPVQAGSGDPSPDNVRPISGWDAVEVNAAGENLWGGSAFLKLADNWTNAVVDTESMTLTGRVQDLTTRANIFDFSFKQNTKYTIFMNASVANAGFYAVYADGTEESIATTRFVSNPSKTLAYLRFHIATSSAITFYANGIGVFEGDVSADAFKPYAGSTYTIQLGGTVYGGTLDVINGVLTVDMAMVDLGTRNWAKQNESGFWAFYTSGVFRDAKATAIICSQYKYSGANNHASLLEGEVCWFNYTDLQPTVRDTRYQDAATFKTAMSGVQLVYDLITPITIQLDPVTISTISGQTNNVWADAGDVSVEYAADLKAYIDRLNQPTEDDMIANTLIQSGKYFAINNRLFLSTASIAAGAQIIPGTNCQETSLAAALNALNA